MCIGTVAGGCWKRVLVRIFASIGRSDGVFIAEIRELGVNYWLCSLLMHKVNAFLSFSRPSLSGLSVGLCISKEYSQFPVRRRL